MPIRPEAEQDKIEVWPGKGRIREFSKRKGIVCSREVWIQFGTDAM